MGNLLVPEPAPLSIRSQVAIARFGQILSNAELTDEDKAQLHFQRGMLYDSVGLGGLAQFDYNRAINFKPNMAEAYNSLGVHMVQHRTPPHCAPPPPSSISSWGLFLKQKKMS